ncbi:NAD(P)-binding protein [Corallococcus sp. 4LFB]|uniref:NAD(P)-binding protein n=1 Tax=Corallococcus sp. 4LFB TaxID=3383249 RepID=UPI003974DD61
MSTSAAKLKLPSGPSRHVYDVIVLGSQVGGALAAALLAKRNHRVLLVEHDGMGPGYEHDGFVLPYAPFVAPPLKAMPAVEEALNELGLSTAIGRALRPTPRSSSSCCPGTGWTCSGTPPAAARS